MKHVGCHASSIQKNGKVLPVPPFFLMGNARSACAHKSCPLPITTIQSYILEKFSRMQPCGVKKAFKQYIFKLHFFRFICPLWLLISGVWYVMKVERGNQTMVLESLHVTHVKNFFGFGHYPQMHQTNPKFALVLAPYLEKISAMTANIAVLQN